MNGCWWMFVITAALVAILVPIAIAVLWNRIQHQDREIKTLHKRLDSLVRGLGSRITLLEGRIPRAEGDPRSDDSVTVTADNIAQPAPPPKPVVPTPLPPKPARERPMPATPVGVGDEPTADEKPAEQPAQPSQAAAPSAAPPAAQGPKAAWPKIDWEQWIGVRGFAVLGGVVLSLAGVLFVKDLADRGFFPPAVRVTLAYLAGIAAVFAGERLRPRGYALTANALAGAGTVILYAATWAASRLFDLIGYGVGFALMALVTVAAGLLAWRHRSTVIATLGLIGGFATPLLLGSDFDHPVGLFGYLLLLNGSALFLVRRRRWPALGVVGLVATTLYFAGWTVSGFGASDRPLALVLLALSSGLYALVGYQRGERDAQEQRHWSGLRAAGLFAPFLFALYLAGRTDLGEHLAPTAGLMALLSFAAGWLEQRGRLPIGTAAAAAAASLAVFTVWLWDTQLGVSGPAQTLAWEANAIAVGLAVIFLALLALRRRVVNQAAPGSAASLTSWDGLPTALLAGGSLLQLALRPGLRDSTLWPWMVGMTGLSWIMVRTASVPKLAWLVPTAAGLMGLGNVVLANEQFDPLSPAMYFGLVAGISVAWQIVALAREIRSFDATPDRAVRAARIGAVTHPLVVLIGLLLIVVVEPPPPAVFLATILALTALAILAVTRLASGKLYLAVVVLASGVLTLWSTAARWEGWSLAVQAALVIGLTFWPFLSTRTLAANRWALYGAALAGPLSFLSLRERFIVLFGNDWIGLLPLALAALGLAAAILAQRQLSPGSAKRNRSQAWLLAVALAFVALAVPLQLSEEWWTIAWALQGLAMIALWRRLDHPGLKYFGGLLLAAATARLLLNPAILGYHQASGWPIVNWLLYTYWLPAAALVLSLRLLAPAEAQRARPFESGLYRSQRPILGLSCGLAAVLVVFAWINLTIFDLFAGGSLTAISFDRQPARELSLSLAWAVYALSLLGLGLRRRKASLRWISLVVLLLTIVKVFLFDLGNLAGLYRVGSLAGLAISLLIVSLVYQRFVFTQREVKP